MKGINLFTLISMLLFVLKYSNVSSDVSYWSIALFMVIGLIFEWIYFIFKNSEIINNNSQKVYDQIDDIKRNHKIRVERRKIQREYRKRRIKELDLKK